MIKWQTKKKSRSVQRKTRSFFRQRRSGTISVDSPKWPPSQNTNPQRRHSTIFVWMPTWTISCTAGYSQHAYMLSFWRCRSKHKICSTVIILWMLVWTIICTAGYRQLLALPVKTQDLQHSHNPLDAGVDNHLHSSRL